MLFLVHSDVLHEKEYNVNRCKKDSTKTPYHHQKRKKYYTHL